MPTPSDPLLTTHSGLLSTTLETVRVALLREVLDRAGRVRLRVQGTSMLPCIWPGQVVDVSKVEVQDLSNGDVLLLARAGRLFCHRLVRIAHHADGTDIHTRGDFLGVDDPPFSAADLLGRVDAGAGWTWALAASLLRAACHFSTRPATWLLRLRS